MRHDAVLGSGQRAVYLRLVLAERRPYPHCLARTFNPLHDQMEERDKLGGLDITGTNVLTRDLFRRLRQQTLTEDTTFNLQIKLEGELISFRVGIIKFSAAAAIGVEVCVSVSAAVPAAADPPRRPTASN